MREGDDAAHETIWVFPASSSHFGTGSLFPFFLSVLHAMSLLCTHTLFIVAFINNLIEKQWEESHPNITGANGTDRAP